MLAHSAPPFNIDSDEWMTPKRGKHFRVLSDFLKSLGPKARLDPDPQATAATDDITVWGLRSGDQRALWVLGEKTDYGKPVQGAKVKLGEVLHGRYEITWYDDVKGTSHEQRLITSESSELVLEIPTFTRHVAGILTRSR